MAFIIPFIPLIVGAGTATAAIVAAGETSGATKAAAQTQANSAQQALNVTTQEFNAQQQALQPYRGASYGALSQLDSAFGIPAGGGYEAPVPIPGAVQPNGSVAPSTPATTGGSGLNTPPPSALPAPGSAATVSGGPVAQTPSTPYGASVAGTQSPNLSGTPNAASVGAPIASPTGATSTPTVRLRLANGQTGTIPTSNMTLINQYVAQGAQIIG